MSTPKLSLCDIVDARKDAFSHAKGNGVNARLYTNEQTQEQYVLLGDAEVESIISLPPLLAEEDTFYFIFRDTSDASGRLGRLR